MSWIENVGDHPKRSDSPEYVRSKKAMVKIIQSIQPWIFGPPPYQDHHSGSVPVHDDNGWLFVLDLAGSEWSGQFCLDPAKVDEWRKRVARIVAAFPRTVPELEQIGYPDAKALLTTEIMDATTIGKWVDGVFNASLPMPVLFHTGVLKKGSQQAGIHHYPKPVVDLQFLKDDSFVLWVTDAQGQPAAVTPVAAKGLGDARVRVAYATPGTNLDKRHLAAHAKGQALILSARHPMAKQAFVKQP
jgi:hypothetical protein